MVVVWPDVDIPGETRVVVVTGVTGVTGVTRLTGLTGVVVVTGVTGVTGVVVVRPDVDIPLARQQGL